MAHQNGPDFLHFACNGIVTRPHLLGRGWSPEAVKHAVASGRLFPKWPGVYAVGTPQVTQLGLWTGAVLACGPEAALSDADATAFWEIGTARPGCIEVTVPRNIHPRSNGIKVHRRS